MKYDFVAKTRKQSNSIVITIPSEIPTEENRIYQFSINTKKEGDGSDVF